MDQIDINPNQQTPVEKLQLFDFELYGIIRYAERTLVRTLWVAMITKPGRKRAKKEKRVLQ